MKKFLIVAIMDSQQPTRQRTLPQQPPAPTGTTATRSSPLTTGTGNINLWVAGGALVLADDDISAVSTILLGFGDGFVEIEEVSKAGGVAVGVASNEEKRQGVNAWKRERLIRAGADAIVGDYRCRQELLEYLNL